MFHSLPEYFHYLVEKSKLRIFVLNYKASYRRIFVDVITKSLAHGFGKKTKYIKYPKFIKIIFFFLQKGKKWHFAAEIKLYHWANLKWHCTRECYVNFTMFSIKKNSMQFVVWIKFGENPYSWQRPIEGKTQLSNKRAKSYMMAWYVIHNYLFFFFLAKVVGNKNGQHQLGTQRRGEGRGKKRGVKRKSKLYFKK